MHKTKNQCLLPQTTKVPDAKTLKQLPDLQRQAELNGVAEEINKIHTEIEGYRCGRWRHAWSMCNRSERLCLWKPWRNRGQLDRTRDVTHLRRGSERVDDPAGALCSSARLPSISFTFSSSSIPHDGRPMPFLPVVIKAAV
jgi:hypothetical protein